MRTLSKVCAVATIAVSLLFMSACQPSAPIDPASIVPNVINGVITVVTNAVPLAAKAPAKCECPKAVTPVAPAKQKI